MQGWQATRTRAGQVATRLRVAFAGGRRRLRRSSSTAAAAAEAGAGGAGGGSPGYRPLGGGGRRRSGGVGREEEERSEGTAASIPSMPSRLREVLVAGSVGSSSYAEVGSETSPRQPLLGPAGGSPLSSDRSPQR